MHFLCRLYKLQEVLSCVFGVASNPCIPNFVKTGKIVRKRKWWSSFTQTQSCVMTNILSCYEIGKWNKRRGFIGLPFGWWHSSMFWKQFLMSGLFKTLVQLFSSTSLLVRLTCFIRLVDRKSTCSFRESFKRSW